MSSASPKRSTSGGGRIPKGAPNSPGWSLKVTELKDELRTRGLKSTGLKKELVERYEEALEAEGETSEEMRDTVNTSVQGGEDVAPAVEKEEVTNVRSEEEQQANKAELDRESRQFYSLAAICLSIVLVVLYFKPAAGPKCQDLSFWWMLSNLKADLPGVMQTAWVCADEYNSVHSEFCLGVFIAMYVSLQTFAIPGPIVLSALSGALYGFWAGQFIVAACATFGASMCFLLSNFFGRGVLNVFKLNDKVQWYREQVQENKDSLFAFMFLSRVTPVPNVLVNVASPLVGVPLWAFTSGTLFGLMPLNLLHVSTGLALAGIAKDPTTFQKTMERNRQLGFLVFGVGSVLFIAYVLKKRANNNAPKAD